MPVDAVPQPTPSYFHPDVEGWLSGSLDGFHLKNLVGGELFAEYPTIFSVGNSYGSVDVEGDNLTYDSLAT